jgi:hypothetical protein
MSDKWYDNDNILYVIVVFGLIICGGIFFSIEDYNKSKVKIAQIELEKAKIEHGVK